MNRIKRTLSAIAAVALIAGSIAIAAGIQGRQNFKSDTSKKTRSRAITMNENTTQLLGWEFTNSLTGSHDFTDAVSVKWSYTDAGRTFSVVVTGSVENALQGKVLIEIPVNKLSTNTLAGVFDWQLRVESASETLGYAFGKLTIEEDFLTQNPPPLVTTTNIDWQDFTYQNTTLFGPYVFSEGFSTVLLPNGALLVTNHPFLNAYRELSFLDGAWDGGGDILFVHNLGVKEAVVQVYIDNVKIISDDISWISTTSIVVNVSSFTNGFGSSTGSIVVLTSGGSAIEVAEVEFAAHTNDPSAHHTRYSDAEGFIQLTNHIAQGIDYDIIPAIGNSISLGSAEKPFKEVHVGNDSLVINTNRMSVNESGNVEVASPTFETNVIPYRTELDAATNTLAGVLRAETVAATNDLNTAIQADLVASTNTLASVLRSETVAATNDLNTAIQADLVTATNDLNAAIQADLVASTNTLASVLRSETVTATNDLNTSIQADLVASTNVLAGVLRAETVVATNDLNTAIQADIVAATNVLGTVLRAETVVATNDLNTAIQADLVAATNVLGTVLRAETVVATNDLNTAIQADLVTSTNVLADVLRAETVVATNDLNTAIQTDLVASTNVLAGVLRAETVVATNDLNTAIQADLVAATNVLGTVLRAETVVATNDLNTAIQADIVLATQNLANVTVANTFLEATTFNKRVNLGEDLRFTDVNGMIRDSANISAWDIRLRVFNDSTGAEFLNGDSRTLVDSSVNDVFSWNSDKGLIHKNLAFLSGTAQLEDNGGTAFMKLPLRILAGGPWELDTTPIAGPDIADVQLVVAATNDLDSSIRADIPAIATNAVATAATLRPTGQWDYVETPTVNSTNLALLRTAVLSLESHGSDNAPSESFDSGWRTWSFTGNQDREIWFNSPLPEDADATITPELVVTFKPNSVGGAAVDVVLQLVARYVAVGEITDGAAAETLVVTNQIINVDNEVQSITFSLDESAIDDGDVLQFEFHRLGGDAGDTWTGNLGVMSAAQFIYNRRN